MAHILNVSMQDNPTRITLCKMDLLRSWNKYYEPLQWILNRERRKLQWISVINSYKYLDNV